MTKHLMRLLLIVLSLLVALLCGCSESIPPTKYSLPRYPRLSSTGYGSFKYNLVSIGVSGGAYCHVRHAQQLADRLAQYENFQRGRVVVLVDSAATGENIRHEIISLGLGSSDVLILYFGSHGSYRNIRAFDRSIAYDGLAAWILKAGAEANLVILSGCYTGSFLDSIEDGGESFAVLTSTDKKSGVSSYGGDRYGKGFAPAFLEAVDGDGDLDGDGVITLGELATYIEGRIEYWLKENHQLNLRHPVRYGPGDFVVAYNQ